MTLLQAAMILARRALIVAYGYAIATLVAGGLIATWYVDWTQPALGVLAAALLVAPGFVLLHVVSTIHALGRSAFSAWARGATLYGVSSLGLLSRPWYWGAVFVSFLAGLALVPLAVILAVLGG